ncbi:MAG: hypothetical protein JXQ96_13035 [Cyclobacteriaceae bacterium]
MINIIRFIGQQVLFLQQLGTYDLEVKKGRLKFIVSILLSALLFALGWPPSKFNFLLFVAFVPALILAFEQQKTRTAFFIFFFTILSMGLMLYGSLLLAGEYVFPIIVGFLIAPALWSLSIIIPHKVSKKHGLNYGLMLFPFFYLSQEILHYYLHFGITYSHLGFGLVNNPIFLGVYPYLGLEGGSFMVIGLNTSLVFFYMNAKKSGLKFKYSIPTGILLLIILISAFVQPPLRKIRSLNVAIFQPDKQVVDSIEDNLEKKIDLLEVELKNNLKPKIDLIICPESYMMDMKKNPLVVNTLGEHKSVQRLSTLCRQNNLSILSGAILVKLFRAGKPPTSSAKKMPSKKGVYFDIYNGSVFVTPDGKVSWRSKQRLLPFSESIPFYEVINFLEGIGLWPKRIGKTYGIVPFEGPFEYQDICIAPMICYESSFPSTIQGLIQHKANLAVVLSTTWTDSDWMRQQHQDAMPAIQRSFGKTVIYSTLDQESSVVDHFGRKKHSDKSFEVKSINLYDSAGFYPNLASKPWIWVLLNLILLVGVFVIKIRR